MGIDGRTAGNTHHTLLVGKVERVPGPVDAAVAGRVCWVSRVAQQGEGGGGRWLWEPNQHFLPTMV